MIRTNRRNAWRLAPSVGQRIPTLLRVGSRGILAGVLLVGSLVGVATTAVSHEISVSPELAASPEMAASPMVAGPRFSRLAELSSRTVSVALSVDRDGASLVAFTLKDRPFARLPELAPPRPVGDRGPVQIEVALLGPGGASYVQRLDVNGLCLQHPADTPAHVEGDTIRLHREVLIVEVPEKAGFETLEVGYHAATATVTGGEAAKRVALGPLALSSDRFTTAGGRARYRDLAFASSTAAPGPEAELTPGTVHWPEEFGDSDIYTVYGSEADAARRINIVIVPDGYTYAEKNLMKSHAQSLVNFFRSKTPSAEHDPFVNYTLVYAYSTESGTDECDCSVVKDTAMNTRFPLQTATCGSSDNRCLYYGTGNGGPNCDPNTSATNIAAAELRAPVIDTTLIMVNTTRYGGCGGYRAVYSAGNGSAVEVAVHELGHSLAGLADEYAYTSGCGSYAGEINTSRNAAEGAWPEWIPDIGAPYEGAQYYSQCLYRPVSNCEMRALGAPFCAVCNQRWALVYFGWFRVAPTAPIESMTPPSVMSVAVGAPANFSVTTRLATGVTNQITWRLEGPGLPTPAVVGSGTTNITRAFTTPGDYALSCEVTADTNFVKRQKYGANRDYATWSIHVTAIPEVSGDPIRRMTIDRNGGGVDIRFEDVGAAAYNVYVSKTPGTAPFAVANPGAGKKTCAVGGVTSLGAGMNQLSSYDLDGGLTGNTDLPYVLISAVNGPGTEGSLGRSSASVERLAEAYCNRATP